MKKIFTIVKNRWNAAMPLFFKWIMGIGAGLASIALAVHTAMLSAGAQIPDWWNAIYPYIIGVGAGMTAAAKLTQTPQNNDTEN